MYDVFDYCDKKQKYEVLYKDTLEEDGHPHEYKIDYIECYKLERIIKIIHYFFCFLSFGLVPLVLSWFPIFYFKLLHSKCSLNECEKVLIVTREGNEYIEKLKDIKLYNNINVVMNEYNDVYEKRFDRIQSFSSKNLLNNCIHTELGNEEQNDVHKFYSDIESNYEKTKKWEEGLEFSDYNYSTHMFEFLGIRYAYIRRKKCFVELYFYISYPLEYIHSMSDGLQSKELIKDRKLLYGECCFNIKLDSIFELLYKEFIHPFFIFQICAMIVWSLDDYYEYAMAILFITAISTILELHSTYVNQNNLKSMIDYKCLVKVHRHNSIHVIDSSQLVPGDIYEIENNMIIPCDTILLMGNATMSEHMLTGESVPVNKFNLPFLDEFDGTKPFKQKRKEKEKLSKKVKYANDIINLEEKNRIRNELVHDNNNSYISNNNNNNNINNGNIDNNYNNSNIVLTNMDNNIHENWNNTNLTHKDILNINDSNIVYRDNESKGTINKYKEERHIQNNLDDVHSVNNSLSYETDSSSYYGRKKKRKKKVEKKYNEKIIKHTLYAGTTVLSVNNANVAKKKNKVLGLVIRIGFTTTKGKIINNMLHYKKARLNLIQDSYKFLAMLAVYAILSGFIVLFITYLNNCFSYHTIIIFLDLITDAVPPALPTTLTVGITIAMSRLKNKYSISCISPSHINLAGQINTMVFDKTGTLTDNKLDFLGIVPNTNGKLNNFIPINDYESFPENINNANYTQSINYAENGYSLNTNSQKKANTSIVSTIMNYMNNEKKNSLCFNNNNNICEYHNLDIEINDKEIVPLNSNNLNDTYLNKYGDNNNCKILNHSYNQRNLNRYDNNNINNNNNYDKKENFNKIMESNYSIFLDALACCHSLTKINNELIGDILEILMFESTNYDIEIDENCIAIKKSKQLNNFFSSREENSDNKPIYYILKQFEFNSDLQRMSVIAQNVENGKYYLFCKGSPEKIKKMCLKSKIPDNYDDILHKYAKIGMRVISLSYKELDAKNHNIFNITRNSLEKNLSFLGFLIFANKLKNNTYDIIKTLKNAGCQCIMSTGDNLLTSISVAKQCGIINQSIESIIIGDVITVNKTKKIVWYVDENDTIFKNKNVDASTDNKSIRNNNDKQIDADSNRNNSNTSSKELDKNELVDNNTSNINFEVNIYNKELYKNKENGGNEETCKDNNNINNNNNNSNNNYINNNNNIIDRSCKNGGNNTNNNLKKEEKKKKIEKYPNDSRLVFDDLCEILIHRDPRSIGIVLSGEAFIFLKKEFERLDLPFYDECEKITYNIMKNNFQKKKNEKCYNSKIVPKYIENLHNKNICYNKLFYEIQNKLFKNLNNRFLKKRKMENYKNRMRNKNKNTIVLYGKGGDERNYTHLMNIENINEESLLNIKDFKNKDENNNICSEIAKNENKNNFRNIKNFIKITQKRKIMDALLIKQDSSQEKASSDILSTTSLNKIKNLKKKKIINRFNNLTEKIFFCPKPLLSFCIIKEKKIRKIRYLLEPPRDNIFSRFFFHCTNCFFNLMKKKKIKVIERSKGKSLKIHSFYEDNYRLSKLDKKDDDANNFELNICNVVCKKKRKKKEMLFFKNKSYNNKAGIWKKKEKKMQKKGTTDSKILYFSTKKYEILKEDYLFNDEDLCTTATNLKVDGEKEYYKEHSSAINFDRYRNNKRENDDICLFDEQNDEWIENNRHVQNKMDFKSKFYDSKAILGNYSCYKCKKKDKKKKIINNKKNIYINKNKLLVNDYLGCLKQSLYHDCKTDTCCRYSNVKNIKLSIYEYILRACTVYARMKPEYKTQLILSLKNLPHNPYIGMCGDGSNDCGALKCADIGISLSNNESSICAPFTSDNFYLNNVINILIEGRAALVNSFQLFKFISLYSIMQCSVVLILYSLSNNLTDNQFIYSDIFTILPLSIFMSWTSASEKLSKNLPLEKLFCFPVFFNIYGQIIIQLIFISVSLLLLFYQPFFKDDKAFPLGDAPNKKLACTKNTVVFLVSSFQLIFICISLNIKTEWRKSIITNVLFVAWILILILINVFVTIFSSDTFLIGSLINFLKKYLNLVNLPIYFRFYLSIILIINFIFTFTFEKYIIRYLEKKEVKKNYKHSHINIFPVPTGPDTKVFVTCL